MKVRRQPCAYCPYRADVPSGVWHRSEYIKLPKYDKPTGEQPLEIFGCHEATGMICAGWAQCHGGELLALRILAIKQFEFPEIPVRTVPLFASGKQAAEHGMKEITRPKTAARRAIAKLIQRRIALQKEHRR